MISLAIDKTRWKKGKWKRKCTAAVRAAHFESLAIESRHDFLPIRQNLSRRKLVFAPLPFWTIKKTPCPFFLLTFRSRRLVSLMHFSVSRHRHSPCLGTFSRISGHFVIAPPPSSSTSFSVLPRLLLLLLHPRLLLPPPPPPPPFLPLPPPASPPSTSGDDSSCCCPLSSFLFLFLPTLLPLIPYDQTTTATNNHLVPLQCRERRCCLHASTNFRTNFPVRCLVLDCAEVVPSSF